MSKQTQPQIVGIRVNDLADLRRDSLEVARMRVVLRDLGQSAPVIAQWFRNRLKDQADDLPF